MADPRFYRVGGPFRLVELAELTGCVLFNAPDPDRLFRDVAPLSEANAETVSFLDNKLYVEDYARSRAGACLVRPDMVERAPKGMSLLTHRDPYRAYAKVAAAFYPANEPVPGIADGAHVDPTATIGVGSRIDPGAAIMAGARVGAGCHIGPNAVVGDHVILSDGVAVGPARVPGLLRGRRPDDHPRRRADRSGWLRLRHGIGRAFEGAAVGPGVDRRRCGNRRQYHDRPGGTGPDTIIGDGAKIDNLVQIAHNVKIGRCCVIVSMVGISGSATIGDFAVLAGQVGVAGHLTIGEGARIAAQSGVMRDVPPGCEYGGSPARPFRDWLKGVAVLEKLAKKVINE